MNSSNFKFQLFLISFLINLNCIYLGSLNERFTNCSKNFWFHRKRRLHAELLPVRKQSLESVRYAADRADDTVKFTDEALMMILNVPRVFLSTVLRGCVSWAKENGVTLVTAQHMKIINDKRSKEKKK